MKHRSPVLLFAAVLLLLLAGCEGASEDQIFSLDEPVGRVDAVLFADLDRSGTLDGQDRPMANVWVGIRFRGTTDTIALRRTSEDGEVSFPGLAPGALEVFVDPASFGDSLVLSSQDPDPLVVILRNVNPVQVAVSYPIVSIDQARGSSPGRRLFVEGVALNASDALPNGALHVQDGTGWIRAENATGAGIQVGDSVRLRGVVHRDGGSTVLRDGLRTALSGTGPVTPLPTSTRQARTAEGGRDGALVTIESATVNQTVFQGGVATTQITDGSGAVFVQIPSAHLVGADLPIPQAGGTVSLTGVLVAEAGGQSWQLRTRGADDVAITSTGSMQGRVFLDRERTGTFDDGDDPLAGVGVRARAAQLSGEVIGEGVTGADGRFQISGLPTGNYQVELDPFTYPDSLSLGPVTPAPIPVRTGAGPTVSIPLRAPVSSTNESIPLHQRNTDS